MSVDESITTLRALLATGPRVATESHMALPTEPAYGVRQKHVVEVPGASAFIKTVHELLPFVLDSAKRFKNERDYYQDHREELMEMAKKQAAAEIAQLKADLEQSRQQEKQTAAVLDGLAGDVEKAKTARVPLELRCPQCDTIHIDQGAWAHEIPHRTHLCHNCKHLWKPYPVGTVGVDVHVSCREQIVALEARRDELLKLVANISQTTPLASELEGWEASRAALIAEIGTLRARIAYLERRQ